MNRLIVHTRALYAGRREKKHVSTNQHTFFLHFFFVSSFPLQSVSHAGSPNQEKYPLKQGEDTERPIGVMNLPEVLNNECYVWSLRVRVCVLRGRCRDTTA